MAARSGIIVAKYLLVNSEENISNEKTITLNNQQSAELVITEELFFYYLEVSGKADDTIVEIRAKLTKNDFVMQEVEIVRKE